MKYDSFMHDHLPVVSYYGEEAMCRCVYHEDSKASLQFNREKGLFVCFGCGAKGGVQKLAQHLGAGPVDTSTTLRDLYQAIKAIERPKSREKALPESSLAYYDIPTTYWTKDRHLDPEIVEKFQLGCSPTMEYVTIPMRDVNGQLLGFIKRYLDPNADVRYKYPAGMKKSHHLYGAWAVGRVKNARTVVLTEGSIDAMKVWQAGYLGMGILGSEVSAEQMKVLLALDVRRVILFFDNDAAGRKCQSYALGYVDAKVDGAIKKRYDKGRDLRRHFSVEAANYPRGRNSPTDPGAMTSEQIEQCVEDTYSYL